jgi:hypothetical protein
MWEEVRFGSGFGDGSAPKRQKTLSKSGHSSGNMHGSQTHYATTTGTTQAATAAAISGRGETNMTAHRKHITLDFVVTSHCYKTDSEIPVHTHDDARRQQFTTGKYFPYESGINTCLAPAVFNTSGIFP